MILEAIEKTREAVEAAESGGNQAVLLATSGKRPRSGCADGKYEQQEAAIHENDNLGWTPPSTRVSGPMPARRDVRRNSGGDVGRLEEMGVGQGGFVLTRPWGRWMDRAPLPSSSRASAARIDATLDGLADGGVANPVANGWESQRIDVNARSEQTADVELADHVMYIGEIMQVTSVACNASLNLSQTYRVTLKRCRQRLKKSFAASMLHMQR